MAGIFDDLLGKTPTEETSKSNVFGDLLASAEPKKTGVFADLLPEEPVIPVTPAFAPLPRKKRKDQTIVGATVDFFSERAEDFGLQPDAREFFQHIAPTGEGINPIIRAVNRVFTGTLEAGLVAFEGAITGVFALEAGAVQALAEAGIIEQKDVADVEKALIEGTELSLIFAGVSGVPAIPRAKLPAAKRIVNQELAAAKLKIGKIEQLTEQPALSRADRFISEVQDALRPIKIAEREAGVPADLNPYRDLRLLAGSKDAIRAVHEKGTLRWTPEGKDFKIEFSGPGLNEVLRPLEGKLDRAMLNFAGRRAKELMAQGREKLFTEGEINAMLAVGEDTALFDRVFADWQAFNKRNLDFAEQSGLLSAETKASFIEMGQSYVPFYRVAEGGSGTKGSIFKRLKGGEANVNDILENITRNTSLIIDASIKNRAKTQTYDLIDRFGLDQFAVKLKKIPETVKVLDKEFRAKIKEMGGDANAVEALTYNTRIADNIDVVFRNGKREFYEIKDPHFLKAMHSVGPQSFNLPIRILAGMKNVLTRGVTLTPGFMTKNLIRDTQQAFIQSKGGFIPLVSSLRGMKTRLVKDDTYWAFVLNGGGFSTLYKGDVQLSKGLRDLYVSRGIRPANVRNTYRSIVNAIEETSSAFEEAARLEEFRLRRVGGASTRDAAFAAREVSTDFAMRGGNEVVRNVMATIPFLNARFQGLVRLVREGKENPATVALKGLGAITVPTLALYAVNKDKPEYKALEDWVKDLHYVFFIPDRKEPILIPKGFEVGAIFGAIPERMFEAIELQHGKRFADAMLRMFRDTFSLGLPVPIDSSIELAANRKFGGSPIVPERLEGVKGSEQFQPFTSETLIELAGFLSENAGVEFSPLQAEHLVRSYFGTLGMYALDAADSLVRAPNSPDKRLDELPVIRGFIRSLPLRRTSFENDFFDLLTEARTVSATVSKMIQEGRKPELSKDEEELFALRKTMDRLSTIASRLSGVARLIQLGNLSGKEKRRQLDEIQAKRNELFRRFSESLPEDIARKHGVTQ